MSEELLRLEGLSKYYTADRSVVAGLKDISLTFRRGEFVAVTGESGSGKSTLAHVLGGILPYEGGELYLKGKPTSHYDSGDWELYRRDQVSFISQNYGVLPGSTVQANVVSALRLSGMGAAQARQEAETILRKVELWELRGRRAAKLSSGQKQRLAIARALAKPAPILIADEPTGNLDRENSAKAIALLAEAAEDRLVILITHEFEEAAEVVTRHIAIHDGRIALDSQLRSPEVREQSWKEPAPKKRRLSPYVAGLQLRARPVWTGLMQALFALTVFAVFAFSGTFLSVWDDTWTRAYDDAAFPNGDSRRIVAARSDGGDITPEDEAALLALEYVDMLDRYSYLQDVKYSWREDVDFVWRYSLEKEGENYVKVSSVTLEQDKMMFARTVPLVRPNVEFLTDGRLPDNVYEVVAAGDETLLGQTVPVYLQDGKNWNRSAYIHLEVTVVGITDYGSGLYFHEDVGRMALSNIKYGFTYVPSAQETGDELLFSESVYQRILSSTYPTPNDPFPCTMWSADRSRSMELICTGAHKHTYNQAYEVSLDTFDQLMPVGCDQIALTVEDYAYTDRVLEALHNLGYAALSPYQEGSTAQNPELAQQRLQTLRICVIAFFAVLALQIVVLRAMFSLETESYRLLSHMGLNCKAARRSVFWQVLLFTVGGQVLGLGAIYLCSAMGMAPVVRLLHYLPLSCCIALSLLHLCACLLTGLWTMNALQRQVYPHSGGTPDLDWNVSGEVEV